MSLNDILEIIVPFLGIIVKYPSFANFKTASLTGVLLTLSFDIISASLKILPGNKLPVIISFFYITVSIHLHTSCDISLVYH